MTKLSLAYAKIVATPTNTGWSQVYNAGSLFAVLSLTVIPDSIEVEEANLPAIGKELLNNLEAEFFTLEEKTFRSIEAAMEKSFNKIVPGITTDACLAYFKDDLLYLFILEKGKIIMKRDELLGLLLEKRADDPRLLTASGRLRQGDIILLQTDHFTQNITEQNITAAFELQLPNDIAESLSPHVHKKEDGSQAAIIIAYNGALPTQSPLEENIELVKEPIPAKTDNQPWPDKKPSLFSISSITKFLKRLKLPIPHLTKRQISALSLGIILLTLLIASIIFTKTQQENAKDEALFRQIYTQAQKNYDEGKALVKLNQNLAQDDFVKAEKILKENINKFKANSQQQIKLLAFLKQIETELNPTTPPIGKISPTTANVTELNFLNIEQKEQAMAFTQDNSSIYMLTDLAVTAIDKATGKKKDILTNNNDWSRPVALSSYQGNIYILDKKAGILKFVAAQDEFGLTDYFKGTPPDLSKAQDLSIDGSIWILMQDGKILKFTRGESENFTITGLNKPLKNPSKIFTDRNTDSLYILDNGNGRILILDKNGQYQNQYNADILQNAKDFEIIEKDQKALILTEDKIWEIPL
ncbi:hypothetical protein KJ980_04185 [Patescibacteria group bacterium]|nr:hypothetical protein [Patescibacteria group bacterium]MBU4098823.1 hypothetical protein [Patescibacteria group bacterium]